MNVIEFSTLGGPEVSHVDRTPEPPHAGEVQIAVKAARLNRAELLCMAGICLADPVLPSKAGFEGAGEVVALGNIVAVFPS